MNFLSSTFFLWCLVGFLAWAQVKPFKKGIYWGVEKNGRIILSPKYECLNFLDSCHIQLWLHGKTGVYNHCHDMWIAEVAYHSVEKTPSGEWIMMKDGKWGIANQKGLLYHSLAFEIKPIAIHDASYLVKHNAQYYIFLRGQLLLPYSQSNEFPVDPRIQSIRPSGFKKSIKISSSVLIWFNENPFVIKSNRIIPKKSNWYLITPYHSFPITQWRYDSSGFLQASYYGKWGVIDFSGHIRIPFLYQQIGRCHLGTFPYQINGRWGILDTLGNRLSFPLYENLIPFHQFYLAKKKKLFVLVNKEGRIIFPLPFSSITLLDTSYYLTKIETPLSYEQINFLKSKKLKIPKDYAFYLINSSDLNIVNSFTDVLVFPFQDSLLLVQEDTGYVIYRVKDFAPLLTTKLKPVYFHPLFHIVEKTNGTMLAIRGTDTLPGSYSDFEWKYGYFILRAPERSLLLDSLWNCLTCGISEPYQDFFIQDDFVWGVSSLQGYGLVDSQFQIIVKPIYDQIWEEGSYLFAKQGNRLFFFNGNGFQEIPHIGDSLHSIGCNLIAIQHKGNWNLYSMSDWEPVVSTKFLGIKPCSNNIIPVLTSQGWNLLDLRRGIYLSDTFFLQLSSVQNGYIYVKTQTGWGIMDTLGRWIHSPTLLGVDLQDPHYNHSFHVAISKIDLQKLEKQQKKRKWVILDSTTQVISDDTYESITYLTPFGHGVAKSGRIAEDGELLFGKCSWMLHNRPILPFVYDSIALWDSSFLLVKQGRYYGLISINSFKIVLPISYFRILKLSPSYFLVLDKQRKWRVCKIHSSEEIQLLKWSFDHIYAYTSRYIVGLRKGKMILHDLFTGLESVFNLDEIKPLSHYPYFIVKDECFFRSFDPLFLR